MSYTDKANEIRKSLSRFDKRSFFLEVIRLLHAPEHDSFDRLKKLPWLCLLSIEWLYQSKDSPGQFLATRKDVEKIINRMHELQGEAVIFRHEGGVDLEIRKMVVSQTWFQRNPVTNFFDLIRIYVILDYTDGGVIYRERFFNAVGVKLDDYFIISLWLLMRLDGNCHRLDFQRAVIELSPRYGIKTISNFFKSLGNRFDDLSYFFSTSVSESTLRDAYFDMPRLCRAPAVFMADKVIVPHNVMLRESLPFKPLSLLDINNNGNIKRRFTLDFESYLEDIIKEGGNKYLGEEDVLDIYKKNGTEGKVVDYIIHDSHGMVFVDAKGIEPHKKVRVSDNPEVLMHRINRSILRAVRQAYECSHLLDSICDIPVPEPSDRYCLVVTLKSFYLQNGKKVRANIAEDFFTRLVSEFGSELIPAENIYFVSIDEFEGALSACAKTGSTLSEFLEYCKSMDADYATSKFEARQHIQAFCKSKGFDDTSPVGSRRLMEGKKHLFDELEKVLEQNLSHWRRSGYGGLNDYLTKLSELGRRIYG